VAPTRPGGATALRPPLTVRLARPEDAEAIRHIYNWEVETSTVTMDLVPRSAEEQRRWLAARGGAHAVVVATLDDTLVGFASLSPWRSRPGYSTTVEDSVYVERTKQGLGVGHALLGELLSVARTHGFHAVIARIAAGHRPSRGLHERFGFEHVGTEREVGRKFGRWIDIDLLQLILT
jgi:L-amino acid N-acyltransferase